MIFKKCNVCGTRIVFGALKREGGTYCSDACLYSAHPPESVVRVKALVTQVAARAENVISKVVARAVGKDKDKQKLVISAGMSILVIGATIGIGFMMRVTGITAVQGPPPRSGTLPTDRVESFDPRHLHAKLDTGSVLGFTVITIVLENDGVTVAHASLGSDPAYAQQKLEFLNAMIQSAIQTFNEPEHLKHRDIEVNLTNFEKRYWKTRRSGVTYNTLGNEDPDASDLRELVPDEIVQLKQHYRIDQAYYIDRNQDSNWGAAEWELGRDDILRKPLLKKCPRQSALEPSGLWDGVSVSPGHDPAPIAQSATDQKTLSATAAASREWQALNDQLVSLGNGPDRSGAFPIAYKACTLAEQTFGPDHPAFATSLNNLGFLLVDNDRAKAETPLRRALEIREKVFGPDHPAVARSLANLARFYASQHRFPTAETLFLRSHRIMEKSLNPDQIELAWSLEDLGNMYFVLKRYESAEAAFKHSLSIRERAGGNHLLVVLSLIDLKRLYTKTYREEELREVAKRLNEIYPVNK